MVRLTTTGILLTFLLGGCMPTQPRAINAGPLLVVPCVVWCNIDVAIEAVEDSQGSTGGSQTQTITSGSPAPLE